MAIAIKEILASDNIRQLAEKVNANFDQLLLNGGGEQGIIGNEGIEGPVGATGSRGALWFYGSSDPNTFQVTLDPLYAGDYYLQSDGYVWTYNGSTWDNTALNLTGPQGTEAGSLIKNGGGSVTTGSAPYDGEDFVFIKPSPELYVASGGFEIRSMIIGGYPLGSTDPSPNAIDDTYALSISAASTGILFVHSHNAATPQIVLSGGAATNTVEPNNMPYILSSIYDNLTIFNPRIIGNSPILDGIKLNTIDSNIDLLSFRDISILAKGSPITGSSTNTGTSAGNINIWSDDIEINNPSYSSYNVANSIIIKNTRTDQFNIIKNTASLELKTISGTKTGNRFVNINTINNDNNITVRTGYVNIANSAGYSILIDDIVGPALTNRYGIYQAGSGMKNLFEGSLEVLNGLTLSSGDLTLTQTSTNNGMLRLNGKSGSTGPMLMIWNPDQATYDYTKIGNRDGNSFSIEKDIINTTNPGTYILQIDESTNRLTIQGDIYRGTSLYLSSTTLGSNIVYSSLTTLSTISSGIWEATDVAVAHGGTGASTAAQARINLGSEIGVNVQAWDINLDQIAAFTPTNSNFIVGDGSTWVVETGNTARTSLGLGTGNSPTFVNLTLTGDLTVTDDLSADDISMSGYLIREGHSKGYMLGSYNSVGENSSKTNPIYTIGSAFKPTDTTLEGMYGIGYTHTNASFLATPLSRTGANWGMYVASAGVARIWLDSSAGSIWLDNALVAEGNIYTDSELVGYNGATLGKVNVRGGHVDMYDTTTTSAWRRLRVNSDQLQFSYTNTTSFQNVIHTGNYTSYLPYISGRRSFTAPSSGWYSIARTSGGDHAASVLKISSNAGSGVHNFSKFDITWYHGYGDIIQLSGGQYASGIAWSDVLLHYDSASPWTTNGNARVFGGGWLSIYVYGGATIYWELEESALTNTTEWSTMDAATLSATHVQVARLNSTAARNFQSTSTIYAPTFSGALSGNATTATTATLANTVKTTQTTSSASRYFVFTTSGTTGTKTLYTDSAATCYINPNTNTIGATTFIGAFSGNATTATLANTVKTTATTSSASRYFVFTTSGTTGTKTLYTDNAATCYINPSTNTIGATTFIGALTGNATTATWADTVDVNTSSGAAWYNMVWNNGDTLYNSTGDKNKIYPYSGSMSTGTLYPLADDGYDLGSNALEWRNLWINGIAYIDRVGRDLIPNSANSLDLGSDSLHYANTYNKYYYSPTTSGHFQFTAPSQTNGTRVVDLYQSSGGLLVRTKNDANVLKYMVFDKNGNFSVSGTLSDVRYKEDIEPIYLNDDIELDKINDIRLIEYNLIEDYDPKKKVGVIAQELMKLYPEYVYTIDPMFEDDEDDDYYSVDYQKLSLLGISGVQKLYKKVINSEQRIKILEDNVNSYEQRIKDLEDKIIKLINK